MPSGSYTWRRLWSFQFLVELGLGFAPLAFAIPNKIVHPPSAFENPNVCAKCHVRQHEEWKGSMMHYSAESPVFQAFELTTRKMTGRFGRHDRQNPTFCINCHTPTGAYDNDLKRLQPEEPTIHHLSETSRNGIHCTMCHSLRGEDNEVDLNKGLLGDSIANAAHDFMALATLVGPTVAEPLPQANDYHTEGFDPNRTSSLYLQSEKMCGSCHNVHVPNTPDTIQKTGYQRQENLYTEWEQGPYNGIKNPHGKKVGCRECHMSDYGISQPIPGKFPTLPVAAGFNIERRHASHRFTAVSISLLGDNPNFPSQDKQQHRREELLKIATTFELSAPKEPKPDDAALPIEIQIINSGTGHRVPSGFSQEREMWVELRVSDQTGKLIYEAGTLQDSPHPETGEAASDGRLHDEDLRDSLQKIEPKDLEAKGKRLGPDFNLRPFRNLGSPTFSNAFMRKKTEKTYERVHFFTKANHMDNERSLPMLLPIPLRYDVPLAKWVGQNPGYCGSVTVEANLHFRTLPPKLLRALIQREPELLSEAHIDRNTLVTMASKKQTVRICGMKAVNLPEPVAVEEQIYFFETAFGRWEGHANPVPYAEAPGLCAKNSCRLASVTDYESLNLANYESKPGDNRDELWTERWAADGKTYYFGGKENRVGDAKAISAPLPFFCVCPKS